MGPNKSPVKGATTQLSRKEAPLTPITGVKGRTSAMMLRAAKIEIKERVKGWGILRLSVKVYTCLFRGSS